MYVQDVFQIGERVRCLVMGMDDNFTRISLSTAEIEENEGDIMFEKVRIAAYSKCCFFPTGWVCPGLQVAACCAVCL